MDEIITQYIPTQWSQVKFQDRGYMSERTRAHYFGFVKGRIYIVKEAIQHAFHTEIFLVHLPDIPFNHAMFDDVPDPEDI